MRPAGQAGRSGTGRTAGSRKPVRLLPPERGGHPASRALTGHARGRPHPRRGMPRPGRPGPAAGPDTARRHRDGRARGAEWTTRPGASLPVTPRTAVRRRVCSADLREPSRSSAHVDVRRFRGPAPATPRMPETRRSPAFRPGRERRVPRAGATTRFRGGPDPSPGEVRTTSGRTHAPEAVRSRRREASHGDPRDDLCDEPAAASWDASPGDPHGPGARARDGARTGPTAAPRGARAGAR